MKTSSAYPLIPETEKRCVWMTGGVVFYKLCPHEYDCDRCSFDLSLRPICLRKTSNGGNPPPRLVRSENESSPFFIDGGTFYHPSHLSVKIETPDEVYIGLDLLLSRLIQNHTRAVLFPLPGGSVIRNARLAHLVLDDCILPLSSPLSGIIAKINGEVKSNPRLLGEKGREEWLVTIKPLDLDGETLPLRFGEEASRWFREEEIKAASVLDTLMNNASPPVGLTMTDGGVLAADMGKLFRAIPGRDKELFWEYLTERNP